MPTVRKIEFRPINGSKLNPEEINIGSYCSKKTFQVYFKAFFATIPPWHII